MKLSLKYMTFRMVSMNMWEIAVVALMMGILVAGCTGQASTTTTTTISTVTTQSDIGIQNTQTTACIPTQSSIKFLTYCGQYSDLIGTVINVTYNNGDCFDKNLFYSSGSKDEDGGKGFSWGGISTQLTKKESITKTMINTLNSIQYTCAIAYDTDYNVKAGKCWIRNSPSTCDIREVRAIDIVDHYDFWLSKNVLRDPEALLVYQRAREILSIPSDFVKFTISQSLNKDPRYIYIHDRTDNPIQISELKTTLNGIPINLTQASLDTKTYLSGIGDNQVFWYGNTGFAGDYNCTRGNIVTVSYGSTTETLKCE